MHGRQTLLASGQPCRAGPGGVVRGLRHRGHALMEATGMGGRTGRPPGRWLLQGPPAACVQVQLLTCWGCYLRARSGWG
ncbi:hypothetical protein GQ55_1G381700 [Panicum hallii var. hallii]|uniref:Uncharacterized protein n=1 Tax=Panicum hallii var. hallii TaxID=1504633 RepID=A0A2T7FBU7_9POAL|nr:hypothetical protein GQ55_1G381700 [Panicum hallii var. hallii]